VPADIVAKEFCILKMLFQQRMTGRPNFQYVIYLDPYHSADDEIDLGGQTLLRLVTGCNLFLK